MPLQRSGSSPAIMGPAGTEPQDLGLRRGVSTLKRTANSCIDFGTVNGGAPRTDTRLYKSSDSTGVVPKADGAQVPPDGAQVPPNEKSRREEPDQGDGTDRSSKDSYVSAPTTPQRRPSTEEPDQGDGTRSSQGSHVSRPDILQRRPSTESRIEKSGEGVAPAVGPPLSGSTTREEKTWMGRLGSKMRSFGTWIKKNPLVAVSGAIGLAWGAVAFTFAAPVVAIGLTVALPILCGGGAYVYHWLDRDDN